MADGEHTIFPLLQAGLEAHRRGALEDAKSAFQRALSIAPDDPDALNLYGAMLLETGEAERAIVFLERAVRIKRNNPAYLGNLAHALFALRRYSDAAEAFRKAARLDPRALQFQLGIANSLAMAGELVNAEVQLKKLAAKFPQAAVVWFNLGNTQRDLQRPDEALASYHQAIALEPQYADARNSLACLLHALMRFEEAELAYRECLRTAPDFFLARCNLASVVMDLGRFDEAASLCRDIIRVAPDLPLAHSFLSAALSHQGRLLDAVASIAVAARLCPADPKIAHNYASALADSDRFVESLQWFARSLRLAPEIDSTHQLLGHALLGHGCFAEGWVEYKYRPWPNLFRAEHPQIESKQTLPDDIRGKHIFLMREQGLGDEIFFLRFAPRLREAGARITYCASAKIGSLLARSSCFEHVTDDLTPPADANTSMLAGDLAHALTQLSSSALPASDTQLQAAPRWPIHVAVYWPRPPLPLELSPLGDRLDEMRSRLARAGPGPYIGITWRSGTPPREQRAIIWVLHKEIGIAPFAASLRGLRGTFVALQRNPQPGEIAELSQELGLAVHNFSDLNEDLEGMLALLSLLDEYIGVSNTNTHLRASVGRTARVLVPSPPDWRWLMNHSKESPWFPGFSVYRQSLQGDWQRALGQLRRDLQTKLA